jgi:hypothetical protein
VPDCCDFARELSNPNSTFRHRWVANKSKPSRMQVARDYGLRESDLRIVKKALDQDSAQPIKDHCGPKTDWVR